MERCPVRKWILSLFLLLVIPAVAACGTAKEAAPPTPPVPTSEAVPPVPDTPLPAETPEKTAPPTDIPEMTPSPQPIPAEPAEPTPAETDDSELSHIRTLIADRRYYDAFKEMRAFEEANSDPGKIAVCEELFGELDRMLEEIEPASGTELVRSFQIQGGGELEIAAWSGPVFVTVIDAVAEMQGESEPDYVSFYVRQNESGIIHVPPGTYRICYQVGYRWFGDDVGFGEFCTEGELEEPLVFDFYMDGGWASYSKYKITL